MHDPPEISSVSKYESSGSSQQEGCTVEVTIIMQEEISYPQ